MTCRNDNKEKLISKLPMQCSSQRQRTSSIFVKESIITRDKLGISWIIRVFLTFILLFCLLVIISVIISAKWIYADRRLLHIFSIYLMIQVFNMKTRNKFWGSGVTGLFQTHHCSLKMMFASVLLTLILFYFRSLL